MFTPGFGTAYGRGDLATLGLGLRALAIPVTVGATATLIATDVEALCFTGCPPGDDDRVRRGIAYGALALGAGLVIAGTVHDLATVRRETREGNEVRRLQIAPTVVSTGAGIAPAVGVAGSF